MPDAAPLSDETLPVRPSRRRPGDVLAALSRPKVGLMLVLGFSSGLPFMLIGNTLGFWLAEDGVKLAVIGFLSWITLTYSVKFLWGAMVDRLPSAAAGLPGPAAGLDDRHPDRRRRRPDRHGAMRSARSSWAGWSPSGC